MFSNVPLLETTEFICEYVDKNNINLKLPLTELKRLILLCTENICFNFQGQYYRQIDGVAMGSPLGPILADIFMAYLEEKLCDSIQLVELYKRYVDDILIISESQSEAIELCRKMNNIHPNIKLTIEHEVDNCIAFLDVKIHRKQDGLIARSVYRKHTWTGQYLHFTSFVPIQYKRGIVKTLYDRARKICTADNLPNELKMLQETFLANGYPKQFIEKHSRPRQKKEQETTVPKLKAFLRLPFKGDDVSDVFERRFRAAMNRTFNAVEPVVVYTCEQIPVPPVKQPLSVFAKSNLIYRFVCGCTATYLGRTERQLRHRVGEHVPVWVSKHVNQQDSRVQGHISSARRTPASSIARHLLETGHRIDTNTAFEVVLTASNSRLLQFAEAIAINRWKPELCKQKELFVSLALPW